LISVDDNNYGQLPDKKKINTDVVLTNQQGPSKMAFGTAKKLNLGDFLVIIL